MKNFFTAFFVLLFIMDATSQNKVYHFISAQYSTAPNKSLYMGGYSLGYRRVTYNFSYGYANGSDHQHLNPEDVGDNKKEGELSSSNVIDLDSKPPNSYLEDVNSLYEGPQARLGFTCFLRRNDTLGRHPFSGPHAGLEASYMHVMEKQTVIYKSETSEQRWTYDQGLRFPAVGAASTIGWQFALLHERLYLDASFVVPFLYPFTEIPNVNSPFAGTRYEFKATAAWHIGWGKSEEKIEDQDGAKVRDKI
jgi:hypothetical protein